jgi:hypothetical protein
MPSPRSAESTGAGTDAVAAHDTVGRLVQRDAEQHVLQHIVFDQQFLAFGHDGAVDGVVRIAAAAQGQAPDSDAVSLDGEHRAATAGIDNDLAVAFHRERFVDDGRAAVLAWRQAQGGAGQRRVEPGLQRLVGQGWKGQAKDWQDEEKVNAHRAGIVLPTPGLTPQPASILAKWWAIPSTRSLRWPMRWRRARRG